MGKLFDWIYKFFNPTLPILEDSKTPSKKRSYISKKGETGPYVSRYSLRSSLEDAALRAFLKIKPRDCSHLKGGFNRGRGSRADYNVSLFTFITGKRRVRCNSCGQKWFEGRKGWEEAIRMVNLSTNSPASSEGPIIKRD